MFNSSTHANVTLLQWPTRYGSYIVHLRIGSSDGREKDQRTVEKIQYSLDQIGIRVWSRGIRVVTLSFGTSVT